MRLVLAIRAFFAALFGHPLPEELAPKILPSGPSGDGGGSRIAELEHQLDEARAKIRQLEIDVRDARGALAEKANQSPEAGALATLGLLQSEGRLLDFLAEDIAPYRDDEVGAAVREVHRGCKKALDDHFSVVSARTEEEQSYVTIPAGYDPMEVRLVGSVVGQPPFSGKLQHRGWRATKVNLPHARQHRSIITPAEVEL